MRAPTALPPLSLSAQVTDAADSHTTSHRVEWEVAFISFIKWIMTPYAAAKQQIKIIMYRPNNFLGF